MKYVMMGISSNFGNMFSAAGASLFLNFLPMLPTQILLNNLMYDVSELTIPTDNVDSEYVEKPKRLDISYIRNFMLYFGPISSIFDFLTFYIMLHVFDAWNNPPLFQTAWFIESLCTQTLVIFAIRTRRSPFFKSRPSRLLFLSSLSVVAAALLLPLTPLGGLFQFASPPPAFFVFLIAFVAVYLALVETLKRLFYKRYAQRLEQVMVPPKGPSHLTPTARLMQTMVTIICLRYEDAISSDSLLDDLRSILVYPVDSEHVIDNLHQLQRAKLVEIDWRKGTIKRQPFIRNYVEKLMKTEQWLKLVADWRRISSVFQTKYRQVNPEYQRLIAQA